MVTLFVVFAAAVAIGMLIRRHVLRRGVTGAWGQNLVDVGASGSLSFLGASTAFLLGLLMLGSLNHFNSTDDMVNSEAVAYSSAFNSAAGLAPRDRTTIQRDLVCLMRSVATSSWTATQSADLTGSENTHAWRDRTARDVNAVTVGAIAQQNSLGTLQTKLTSAFEAGQNRLLAAESDLPGALWITVYISIFVLTVSLTALLLPFPEVAAVLLMSILVLSSAMVWVLTAFAQPFTTDDGVYIAPHALNAVMTRLESAFPGDAWAPCETLANT